MLCCQWFKWSFIHYGLACRPPPPAKLAPAPAYACSVTPSPSCDGAGLRDGVCAKNKAVRGFLHKAGMTKKHITAFSLVELSIVLVILGLLVGGVLSGQSLIRAAELRSISSDFQRYTTAAQTFRDKYFSIPGDMRNATQFWGRLNGNADCATNTTPASAVAAPGVCDGDGNGSLPASVAANQSGESFQFFRQLALAGLIEGNYSGLSGAAGTRQLVAGTNAPRGKISNSAWYVEQFNFMDGTGFAWAGQYGNPLIYGGVEAADINENPILKPEEAWNIDTKLDDGKPALGNVRDYRIMSGCHTQNTQALAATTEYALITTSAQCHLVFISSF